MVGELVLIKERRPLAPFCGLGRAGKQGSSPQLAKVADADYRYPTYAHVKDPAFINTSNRQDDSR